MPLLSFDDLEGIEIRKADVIGFGLYRREEGEESRLIAAFSKASDLIKWLELEIERWQRDLGAED